MKIRIRTRRGLTVLALIAFVGLPLACFLPVPPQAWDPERGPVVPHDSFPADCELCHITEDWHTIRKDFEFDHAKLTGYPLVGAHAAAGCLLCHNDRGPVEAFARRGCQGCHEDPHQGHMGTSCDVCHDQQTWRPNEMIAEHASTRFPLIGAHALAACFACHPGATAGNFQRADTHCESCHTKDLARATNPDHVELGWTTGCEECHRPTAFTDVRFGHTDAFPLAGAHGQIACDACHENNVFTALPTNCDACHLADYQGTTNPAHPAAGFPLDCSQCHSLTPGWRPADFDHDTFALTGAHTTTSCNQCHQGGVFAGTPRDCEECHLADYNGATDPNHATAGFPTQCDACHTTNPGWSPAELNHDFFPLTGGHVALDCAACHEGGVFQGTPDDCASCHLADYNRTSDPNHQQAGFPTTCDDCHSTNPGWTPAVLNHDFFPLTAGHSAVDCASCHENGVFQGTSTDCSTCHLDDYNAATDPNHQSAGFPTSCEDCHTTNPGWSPATVNHDFFPLTLGHSALDCTACHEGGVFTGTPATCSACHLDDYNGTSDPNHQAAGFPTSCDTCHTTNPGWSPASFDHTFPISSGRHSGLSCTDCHENSSNFQQFTCVSCHEHNRTDMDDEHSDVNGYVYSSASCLQCHPQGIAEDD